MPRSGLQELRSVVEQRELVDMFNRADTPQEGVSLCQDGLDGLQGKKSARRLNSLGTSACA